MTLQRLNLKIYKTNVIPNIYNYNNEVYQKPWNGKKLQISKTKLILTINSTIIFNKGIYLCHSPKIIDPLTFNIKTTHV